MENDALPPIRYSVVEPALLHRISINPIHPFYFILIVGENMLVVDALFDVALNSRPCLGVERHKAFLRIVSTT